MADPDAWSRMAAHVRREAALSAVCESLHVAAWSIGQLYSSHRQIRLPRRGASAPPRSWPFSSPHAGSRLAVRRSVLYIVPFDDHTLTQGRDQSSRALRGSSLNPRSRTPVPERFARETASRVSCFVCLRSRVICDICKHSIVASIPAPPACVKYDACTRRPGFAGTGPVQEQRQSTDDTSDRAP